MWFEILNYVFVAGLNDNNSEWLNCRGEREREKKLLWNRLGLMYTKWCRCLFFTKYVETLTEWVSLWINANKLCPYSEQ